LYGIGVSASLRLRIGKCWLAQNNRVPLSRTASFVTFGSGTMFAFVMWSIN
jgi:hypothetical protein